MKVLILYQFDINGQLVGMLCRNLFKHSIESDSLNVVTWQFSSQDKKRNPLLISLIAIVMVIPKVNSLMIKLFRKRVLLSLAENYNIIDIHFFSPIYDELIDDLKQRGKKVKITIWGSDFYRTDRIRREQQRIIYHKVDIIQTETKQICKDFLEVYPEFENKLRIAHFGIIQFDIINELLQKDSHESYKKEMELPLDKIILACGTNGSEGHQHLLIFENIERIDPAVKEQLFLLVPMTYGATKLYIKNIGQKLELLGIPYKLYSSLLSMQDIGKLRIVSDITLTIQKTDALSSAIQEHIYAGSILIAGDWLPYDILHENGVFYLTSTLESLPDCIYKTLNNYLTLKLMCKDNDKKIASISSWDEVIKDWNAIYDELTKKGIQYNYKN